MHHVFTLFDVMHKRIHDAPRAANPGWEPVFAYVGRVLHASSHVARVARAVLLACTHSPHEQHTPVQDRGMRSRVPRT